jgi:hypothetical protein
MNMRSLCSLDKERACALKGKYTINIQSNDGETMFAGLHTFIGQVDFNAHLHRDGDYWCAIIATNDLDRLESASERLASVGPEFHHWVRMMVWDETNKYIVLDRTYSSDGYLQLPIPA